MRQIPWLAFAIICLPSPGFGQDASSACATPRYLLVMAQAPEAANGPAKPLISGLPSRVYEGEPLEWSQYQVTRLPCDSRQEPAIEARTGLIAGVFLGAASDNTAADLVPDECDQPVYLLGVNTVTDAEQPPTGTRIR